MNPVKILTDSMASLTKALIDKYNLAIIPEYVVFDEKSYLDGIDITEDKMYELVEEKKKLPKTSGATPLNFINAFKPWIDQGYDIVYISMSSGFSSTVQNARIASKQFTEGRIYIIDSRNLSSGIGLLALQAAEYSMKGMDAKMIYEKILKLVPRVRTSFIIDTLKYLYMGGRCSSIQRWASSAFKIHPRIIVENGIMIVGEKFKGKRLAVLDGLLKTVTVRKDKVDTHRVFITHSLTPQEDVDFLSKGLLSEIKIDDLLDTPSGCVIAAHCGPKTIGIIYLEKE
ncbi:MAG: DegV family protein [Clostridiales bacterium]|nr:DegV family protein [Clostridiales bacterium]